VTDHHSLLELEQFAEIIDLEDLVRFLALTYGDNDPVLPLIDAYGTPLDHNARLHATWMRVIRQTSEEDTPTMEDTQ
jgi:hypothetical protein